jgi:hypothetical protein
MANPNPRTDQLSPFQPGQSGNPGGISKEAKARMMRNAEMALRMRERMLEAEIAKIDADPDYVPDVKADTLSLVKSSEDRGFGSPTTTLAGDPENPVGITTVRRVIVERPGGDT